MRPLLSVLLAAAVLGASACGSASRSSRLPAPRFPRAVAGSLAARSDALAAALRRGDGCAARIEVHGLERQTRLAVAAGSVPAVYRARLLAAVERLAGRIPQCVPPPPPPPPVAKPAKGHDKHGGHPPKHGKHPRGGGD